MASEVARHEINDSMEVGHTPDGAIVEARVGSSAGGLVLRSSPELMFDLATKLSEVSIRALTLKNQDTAHGIVSVRAVFAANAKVPPMAIVVVLELKDSNGTPQYFSITPGQSLALRSEMEAAEDEAVQNKKQAMN